jgi:excisionase family DNA binding protein
MIVVDPLVEFVDGKFDAHKSQQVRQVLASLNAIARQIGCAIFVVIHLNKGSSTDPLLRHEGSAAFTQIIRGALLLGHDPNDPDGEAGGRRVLATTSSNLAKLAASLVYEIRPATVHDWTGAPITTAAISHVGESEATGPDLLKHAADSDAEQSAFDEAEEFLRAELAAGPKLAKNRAGRPRWRRVSAEPARRCGWRRRTSGSCSISRQRDRPRPDRPRRRRAARREPRHDSRQGQVEIVSVSCLTVQEVAQLARCEHKTVRRAIHGGALTAYKPAGRLLIREDDARTWIEGCRVAHAPAHTAQTAPKLARRSSVEARVARLDTMHQKAATA